MKMTLTRSSDKYIVHELLTSEDSITPCDPPPAEAGTASSFYISETNVIHPSELVGSDIRASPDGFWRSIATGYGVSSPIVVDAGPILHRGAFGALGQIDDHSHTFIYRSLYWVYLHRS